MRRPGGRDRGQAELGYNGILAAFVPKGWNDSGQVAANLSFDLDLWGKNRASLAAATSDAEAARIELEQSRLGPLRPTSPAPHADLARLPRSAPSRPRRWSCAPRRRSW